MNTIHPPGPPEGGSHEKLARTRGPWFLPASVAISMACVSLSAAGGAESSADGSLSQDKPPGGRAASRVDLPWKLGADHRFVWLRDGQKVGETVFRIEEEAAPEKPAGDGKEDAQDILRVDSLGPHVAPPFSPPGPPVLPPWPPRGGSEGAAVGGAEKAYVLTASRSYDRDGVSQRGKGRTRFRGDGTPLAFEETVDVSTIRNLKAHQETSIRFDGKKALVTYISNGKTDVPLRHEVELSPETYLYANQAVEHWVIFASRIPCDAEKHPVKLFYPDFSRVFEVTFRSAGDEKLKIGAGEVAARRYTFQSTGNELNGRIWVDAEGRLIQVEFPGSIKEMSLRVVLDPR